LSEDLDYESPAAPPSAPRSPVGSVSRDVAVALNVLSAMAGTFLAIYVYAGIADRGEGEGNWAALGAVAIGVIVVPLQLIALAVSFALATREVPGAPPHAGRWAVWTAPAGLAIPVLAAFAAFLVVMLR
jgi:hypothetical protein